IFETHAAVESYEASKQFFGCMMEEGSSVSEHMFAMSGHAKKLSDLGIVIPNQLGIHRVLQSPPPSYKNFVMKYNMQNMNKELPELFSMLKSAEVEIQKEHQVLMVNKTTKFKKQGKPKKDLKKGGKKAAAPPEKPKGGPKPDTDCYYCNGKGHWKRNCPKYLADLKSGLVKKKKGISDIHLVEEQEIMNEERKGEPLSAIDYFKATHNGKTGYAEPVQKAIAEMEKRMVAPLQEGQEQKSATAIVAEELRNKRSLARVDVIAV
ncbi:hypothetical protein QYE76_007957, partial [Lolium multiflorum]